MSTCGACARPVSRARTACASAGDLPTSSFWTSDSEMSEMATASARVRSLTFEPSTEMTAGGWVFAELHGFTFARRFQIVTPLDGSFGGVYTTTLHLWF